MALARAVTANGRGKSRSRVGFGEKGRRRLCRLYLGLHYNWRRDCFLRSCAKGNRETGHFLNEDVGSREVVF